MDSFLNECGLSDAIETFKRKFLNSFFLETCLHHLGIYIFLKLLEHKLEMENLVKLTENEIKELLPNIGDRHKLLDAISIRKVYLLVDIHKNQIKFCESISSGNFLKMIVQLSENEKRTKR